MNGTMTLSPAWIAAGVGFLVLIYIIALYNALVRLKNNVDNAFADIDVQLKARFSLVDNLVNTVKGYASHEKTVLENVTKARTDFMNAQSPADKMAADNMLTGALKSLFAVSENYPDLKANQNFLQLQTELSDLENKIAAARRFYNASVKELHTKIETFPSNMIAGMFGFSKREYFEITDEAEKATPKVDFSK